MLPDFDRSTFAHNGITHTLYVRGEGPGVVLIHELPGMTPQCIALANRLANAGYRVYMPLLFGEPGRAAVFSNTIRICVSREFYCFATRKTSPVVEWLKAVCHKAHGECGGPGVGAIGMCLTGNFAIALMADASILAPVACQPALPFALGKKRRKALGLSPKDLEKAKKSADDGQQLLGFRFTCDRISPAERFRSIEATLGPAFVGMEIDSSPGNTHGIEKRAHSVLTNDFVDKAGHPTREALDRVLSFFSERLLDQG